MTARLLSVTVPFIEPSLCCVWANCASNAMSTAQNEVITHTRRRRMSLLNDGFSNCADKLNPLL